MERVFVDTSFWYALTNRDDIDHTRARDLLKRIALPLFTSNAVLAESLTLIRYKLGHATAMTFGEDLQADPDVTITRLAVEDEREAWRIFCRYRDKKLSFVDCSSFALIKRLGTKHALSFDGDFERMGFRPPLN